MESFVSLDGRSRSIKLNTAHCRISGGWYLKGRILCYVTKFSSLEKSIIKEDRNEIAMNCFESFSPQSKFPLLAIHSVINILSFLFSHILFNKILIKLEILFYFQQKKNYALNSDILRTPWITLHEYQRIRHVSKLSCSSQK